MNEPTLLGDLVLLFAAALPIVLVFERLNLPSVVGFLLTGIVIGPHGIGLIAHSSEVDSLAELGLVLLLFVAGLELSFSALVRVRRVILWSGTLQVTVTVLLAAGVALACGAPGPLALFGGFLAVHSSTAIVIKTLADRGEIDAPHSRLAAGILLIQDLSLVPMILLTRMLANPAAASWVVLATTLAKAAAAVAGIVVAARVLMPAVLRQVVRLRSRELFTGVIVLFSFGTAWLASALGLSLALGALLAGLVISESEFSHQAFAEILPFRDVLNSVFFISIGMLLGLDFLLHNWLPLVGGAVALVALKVAVGFAVILPFYPSVRIAAMAALALGATGEMVFVLSRFALPLGLITAAQDQALIGITALTMLMAPFLIAAAPAWADRVQALVGRPERITGADLVAPRGHVLIVGYGLNGENLARVLRQTGLPFLILELNPERVGMARQRGEPVLYGDASRLEVLHKARVGAAHAVVVAISDPVATRRIVALTRHLNARVPIIVRTRYVAEIDELNRLGATEVIPEEFETSVEIFARVLRRFRVPRNIITLQVDLIRKQGYSMLRGLELPRQTLDQLGDILAATTTESFLLPVSSPVVGRTIRELGLRRTTGVTIIAVVRDNRPLTNPPPDLDLRAGDIVVMVGSHVQLDRALMQLSGEHPEAG
jgi:CPA2 family monovalent cation:H+ antiporter-2